MPEETPHLGLRLPEDDDPVNVNLDLAANLTLIDTAIEELASAPPPSVPAELVWNFRGDLTPITGTPFYPLRAGEIVQVRLNVRLPGASTVVFDLFKNGVSMFPGTKPSIPGGQTLGTVFVPDDGAFEADDRLEPSIVNSAGATDLMATIEIRRTES